MLCHACLCPKCEMEILKWTESTADLFFAICVLYTRLQGKPVCRELLKDSKKDKQLELALYALERKGCLVSHEDDQGLTYVPKFCKVSHLVNEEDGDELRFQFCIERHLNVAQQ